MQRAFEIKLSQAPPPSKNLLDLEKKLEFSIKQKDYKKAHLLQAKSQKLLAQEREHFQWKQKSQIDNFIQQ